jgi:hypothetical protein
MRFVVAGGLLCAVNDALKAFDFFNYFFLNRERRKRAFYCF